MKDRLARLALRSALIATLALAGYVGGAVLNVSSMPEVHAEAPCERNKCKEKDNKGKCVARFWLRKGCNMTGDHLCETYEC